MTDSNSCNIARAAVRRNNWRGSRNIIFGICALMLAILSQPVTAANCSFSFATSINFGSYNVFSTVANDSGVGTLRIDCNGGDNAGAPVKLSSGRSPGYAPRWMSGGTNVLIYNLYTNAARAIVWGDGTRGSSTMMAIKNSTTTLNIFGRIPAGQDAVVGVYSDFITVTVEF